LNHPPQRQSKRNGQARPQIALAVAACDSVDSQHHHVDASVLGALQHCTVKAPVLVKVKLIDLRRSVFLAQFFQADRAERRNAEHGPVICRRGRDRAFSVVVE
jgi:hypothetical protein